MGENGLFRHKRNNFSMVSNELIHDKNVSFKAKGLYCMIQSYVTIPNFTLYKTFLMRNCKEGEKAFEAAWKELKDSGYLVQYKLKDETGKFYYEYELLDELPEEKPDPQNRGMDIFSSSQTPKKYPVDNAHVGFLGVANPGVENGGYINNTIPNNTVPNNISSNQIISRADVIRQIGCDPNLKNDEIMDNIAEIMLEVLNTPDDEVIRVNKRNIKAKEVKGRFRKVEYKHMDYITLVLNEYTGDIHNIKSFMITTIYNAVATCGVYFTTRVNHDLYGNEKALTDT